MKRSSSTVLDAAERLLLLALYGWLVVRIAESVRVEGLGGLLLLPSEGLVLVFVLIRRRTEDVSRNVRDWVLAVAATGAPMLVTQRHGSLEGFPVVGAALLLMGMVVQLHAKLSLGLSFGCVPANRGVKVGGPYRVVRHPIYAGYMFCHAGFLLINPAPWNFVVYAMANLLQLPRLLAEERLLANDAQYRRYREEVRYRLIPGLY